MQSFKVLRLRLSENNIFDNIDVSFFDQGDKPQEPYTTLIIGPNGTGKSNLLRTIILLFTELHFFKKEDRRTSRVSGKFCLEYEFNEKTYKYQNHDFDDNAETEVKATTKPRIWVDNVLMTQRQIELPKSIIALSVMLTDKFPLEMSEFKDYIYLGVKINSNTARTSTFITKTINLLYESLDDEIANKHLARGLDFLGYEKALYVSYYPRYKHIFFKGGLTVTAFGDFFKSYWKYTKREKGNPPWSINTFNRLVEKTPERIEKLVDLCNKLSKRLEREYQGSRTQYFEFNVFDNYLTTEETFLIKELHALDLVSYPAIAFKKSNKYFMLEDSSSGEYHFISGFIGLLAKLKECSLILIDEPENSLHPNWQMKYISFLKEVFKDFRSCHFIIASHSHFFVSDLNSNSSTIVGLKKDSIISASNIPSNTYGWSAEEILLTIFKTPSTRNFYLTDKLSKIFELISKEPSDMIVNELKQRITGLRELDLKGLNDSDPLKDVVNQLFKRFENV